MARAPPQGVAVSAAPALLALLVLWALWGLAPWVAAARVTPATQGPTQGGLAGRSW